MDPAYQVPSRKTMMNLLQDMYLKVKGCLMTEISQARWIALTGDFWTSTGVVSYLGVTAHIISPEWKLVTCVLQMREMEESHTAEQVAESLQSVTVEWGITAKLASFIHDNGRNLVAALNRLK